MKWNTAKVALDGGLSLAEVDGSPVVQQQLACQSERGLAERTIAQVSVAKVALGLIHQ